MRGDRRYEKVGGGTRKWLPAWFACCLVAANVAAAPQPNYASPEDAAAALVQAVKKQDRSTVLNVLGQDAANWISSGDAADDRAVVSRFVSTYDAKHAIVRDGDKATLTLGTNDFPFAFPIVRMGERWRFDTTAGKNEMLARRIGENELSAIQVMEAIVDAQLEYASADRNGDGVLTYAGKFASTPGKHDGLYWPVKAGEQESPLGELMVKAAGEGYKADTKNPTPYHGYYYRMLSGQGKNAQSGALDYVVQGREIGGFAAIAYPAKYGNSGVMTFIVNQDGKVYQADLGPDTAARAKQIQKFDPGSEWKVVEVAQ